MLTSAFNFDLVTSVTAFYYTESQTIHVDVWRVCYSNTFVSMNVIASFSFHYMPCSLLHVGIGLSACHICQSVPIFYTTVTMDKDCLILSNLLTSTMQTLLRHSHISDVNGYIPHDMSTFQTCIRAWHKIWKVKIRQDLKITMQVLKLNT